MQIEICMYCFLFVLYLPSPRLSCGISLHDVTHGFWSRLGVLTHLSYFQGFCCITLKRKHSNYFLFVWFGDFDFLTNHGTVKANAEHQSRVLFRVLEIIMMLFSCHCSCISHLICRLKKKKKEAKSGHAF